MWPLRCPCRQFPRHFTGLHSLYTVPAMTSKKPGVASSPRAGNGVWSIRTADVLTLPWTTPATATKSPSRCLTPCWPSSARRRQSPALASYAFERGATFSARDARAGRTPAAIRRESVRIIEFKAALLRSSPLISIAEVQGSAFGFAIVCDFALVAEQASPGFPEMRSGLAPVAILS